MSLSDHLRTSDLRDDPNTITVEFADYEAPYLLNVSGAKKARDDCGIDFVERIAEIFSKVGAVYADAIRERAAEEQGVDPELVDMSEVDEDEYDVSFSRMIKGMDLSTADAEAVSAALYAGFCNFDDDLTPEAIQRHLTIGRMQSALQQISPQLFSFIQDETDRDLSENGAVEEATDEVKKSRSPRSSASSTPRG